MLFASRTLKKTFFYFLGLRSQDPTSSYDIRTKVRLQLLGYGRSQSGWCMGRPSAGLISPTFLWELCVLVSIPSRKENLLTYPSEQKYKITKLSDMSNVKPSQMEFHLKAHCSGLFCHSISILGREICKCGISF